MATPGTPTPDPTEEDFAALSALDLEAEVSEPVESSAPPTPKEPAPPVAPAEPPAPTAPPEEVKVETPEAPAPGPPAETPQPAAVPQPVTAPTAPTTPAAPTREEFVQRRQALLGEIAGRYAVSDEDAERYALEPHKVLPELAARVMLDAFDASIATISSMLPQMINEMVTRQSATTEVSKAFFKQWPQLAKAEYAPHVQKAAALYRQMNPKATAQKALTDVGVLACTSLGIPLTAETPKPAPTKSVPFVPSGAGAVPPAAPVSPNDVNLFERLSTLADED